MHEHRTGHCYCFWCSRPVPPHYSLTNSASFSLASQAPCGISFYHVFPWTYLGKFLPQWQILIYQGCWTSRENLFPYTLDVKILHLILYIGDLRPTIVGSLTINWQLASLKSFEGSGGLRVAQNLGEGSQPAFLARVPSCQHFLMRNEASVRLRRKDLLKLRRDPYKPAG